MMDDEQLTIRETKAIKEWYRADGSMYSRLYKGTGNRYWYHRGGGYHREDGPAIELGDGRSSWWWQGKCIDCDSQEEFERWIRLKAFW